MVQTWPVVEEEQEEEEEEEEEEEGEEKGGAGVQTRQNEEFVALSKSTMQWSLEKNEHFYGVICEKHLQEDNDNLYTTPKPVAGKFYECDKDWFPFENSCYYIQRGEQTWDEASASCKTMGSELASINSVEENNFVSSLLPQICQDTLNNCADLAKSGNCQDPSLAQMMQDSCPRSCGLCDQCVNSNVGCDYWAKIGECKVNPTYMLQYCALSCGCKSFVEPGYWIGLNDRKVVLDFQWSDQTEPKYCNWVNTQPDNFQGKNENCVLVEVNSGAWSDERCDVKSLGSVCKKEKTYKSDKIADPSSAGCVDDSLGYLSKCFKFVKEQKTWSEAKEYCEQDKKQLAVLSDRSTNAFVTSEIYNYFGNAKAWIGFSTGKSNTYAWVDDTTVLFTSFNKRHTGLEKNKCTTVDRSGFWDPTSCDMKYYFVCEAGRVGYADQVPQTFPVTEPPQCPTGWTGFRNYCYKLFLDKANWNSASFNCQGYGGSLMTILDQETNDLVFTTLKKSRDDLRGPGVWIGLTDGQNEGGFYWSDGSPYNFEIWDEKEPNSFTHKEDCVELVEKTNKWNDNDCSLEFAYVCQTVRGGLFVSPSPAYVAPVSFCDTDKDGRQWHEFEGNCYYSTSQELLNWYDARDRCTKIGADLVSISSKRENDFIQQQMLPGTRILSWIGYHDLATDEYKWTDLSPDVFQNFKDGEPNDAYGGEKCVAIYRDDGEWNDDNCMIRHNFVCKKHDGTFPPPTLRPRIQGSCPNGFTSEGFTNKCFFFSGPDDKKDWNSAHKACKNKHLKAELASIGGPLDQHFLNLLIEDSSSDVWIGFNKQGRSEWVWVDNSAVGYTNWLPGLKFYYTYGAACVAMIRNPSDEAQLGKWDFKQCAEAKPYICQTEKEPNGIIDPGPFADQYSLDPCDDDYFLYRGRCYKYFDQSESWEKARDLCKNEDAVLALTFNGFENARLSYETYKDDKFQQAWIGVNYQENLGMYVWNEEHQVQTTFWDPNEPDRQTTGTCVSFQSGIWTDEPCSKKFPFICVKGSYDEFIPPAPSSLQGNCADPDHTPFQGYCYMIIKDKKRSWSGANRKCDRMSMELTSVHSKAEVDFLANLMKNEDSGRVAWIGFQKSSDRIRKYKFRDWFQK
ncbi:macrophage mannose receptor 1-like [Plakobranchus ocellatus]|uniref:Macrophage mannose receptor 1-like n=1 Tax=Plakobranchus ocellatus TaxID=259542 RepID=A0AAV4BZC1_9GAST|nr:macrophage mannose receptor 1-like [Plakobranchus ocellatus]